MRNLHRPLATLFSPVFLVLIAIGCGDSQPSPSGAAEKIQQIGNFDNPTAQAVRDKLTVVRFSPDNDPTTTPMMISPGFAATSESSGTMESQPGYDLTEPEKDAIRRSYGAGQTLSILNPSTDDVKALHQLLGVGAAYSSTTDPVSLAYTMRRENGIPSSRVLLRIRPAPTGADDPGADERAHARAYDTLVGDLSRGPLPSDGSESRRNDQPIALIDNAVQETELTSTTAGVYNTNVKIFAGHACAPNEETTDAFDFYVVTALGDWTPSEATYQSASYAEGQITLSENDQDLSIDWQSGKDYCTAGIDVYKGIGGGFDSRICRYVNYPLDYRVELEPPVGPTTTQINAAPSGTQGTATSYSSGFTFGITGGVNISGDGPSAGIQIGAQWSQSVEETVPPLIVDASVTENQGAITEYKYCTPSNSSESCTSTIQTTGQSGTCKDYIIGDPENGQTPDGRLSNIEQSVYWQVKPDSYGTTNNYEITVNFEANLATSTARLWGGPFLPTGADSAVGPSGDCNTFGCSCSVGSNTSNPIQTSHTFILPEPSKDCRRR